MLVTIGAKSATGRAVFITAMRHRRMSYLDNLVGQVSPQALLDA
jgi:hypothetical protein